MGIDRDCELSKSRFQDCFPDGSRDNKNADPGLYLCILNLKTMRKSTFIVLLGALGTTAFVARANTNLPENESERAYVRSIVYMEEDDELDLGFDTADYLPEDFDPYTYYFDLNSVDFVTDEAEIKVADRLPQDFDAYAYPTDVKGFNYIDSKDEINAKELNTQKYLPAGFDPYSRN